MEILNYYYHKNITLQQALTGGNFRIQLLDGRIVDVKLKPGCYEGQVIRLKNLGMHSDSGDTGDAIIKLKLIDHPLYTIHNLDLKAFLILTAEEARAGAKKVVPGPAGSPIEVIVKPETNSGEIIKIANAGLTKKNKTSNLYFQVKVVSAKDLKIKSPLSADPALLN